jgi:hypothetical protein
MITNLDGSSNHRDMLTGEPARASIARQVLLGHFLNHAEGAVVGDHPTTFKPRYSVYGNHPGNLPYLHAGYLGYLTRSTSCCFPLINNRASSIILVSLMATVGRLPSQRPYKTSESSIRNPGINCSQYKTDTLIWRIMPTEYNRHFLSIKMEWEWAETAFAIKPSVASCVYRGSQCNFPPPSATWLRSLVPACCALLTCC